MSPFGDGRRRARWLDGAVMRVMDGLMSIPTMLRAIGLVSPSRAGLRSVIVAIIIPEITRRPIGVTTTLKARLVIHCRSSRG
jgi:ABC-type dipeptide/oligopeptide/nickel transport system permease subunit